MKATLLYCYDAYCGWCYGFSPIVQKLWFTFNHLLNFEVLSGGMILPEQPTHIGATACYLYETCREVERVTGVRFGADYLWHIQNAEQSDWYPNSEKPAIALCIFKDFHPNQQLPFAADLQHGLFMEGRDLCDDEAYRHLLLKYKVPVAEFYDKLHSDHYKQAAQYEFNLVQQLKVTGYPCVLLQLTESRFHLLANGYTDYITLESRIQKALADEGMGNT